jgi:hypothetical protein
MRNNRWWQIVDLLVWTCAIFVFIGLFVDLNSHAWDSPQFGEQVVFRIRFVVLYLFLFNVVLQSLRRIRIARQGQELQPS